MEFAYKVIGFALVFVNLLLIFFILMQKSTENGLFTSSGGVGNVLSGFEAGNIVFNITKYLSVIFFVIILLMAILGMRIGKSQKILPVDSNQVDIDDPKKVKSVPVDA